MSRPEKKERLLRHLRSFFPLLLSILFIDQPWEYVRSGLLFLVIVILKCWAPNLRSLFRSSVSLLLPRLFQLLCVTLALKRQLCLHHLF